MFQLVTLLLSACQVIFPYIVAVQPSLANFGPKHHMIFEADIDVYYLFSMQGKYNSAKLWKIYENIVTIIIGYFTNNMTNASGNDNIYHCHFQDS